MSAGMGTTAGDEGAPGAPQPTHIDVHIHQETLPLSFLGQPSAPNTPSPAQPLGSKRVLVASWVAQIVLGLLSGALGGLGHFVFYSHWVIENTFDCGIWTGVVALLAGVAVFIHDKRGGPCWALLRTLLALGAFATAIAAICIAADRMGYLYYWSPGWCDRSRWDAPPPPSTPEEARRKELCQSYQYMTLTLFMGLLVILLSVWALLLLASLVPVWLFCCGRSQPKARKEQKVLLAESQ